MILKPRGEQPLVRMLLENAEDGWGWWSLLFLTTCYCVVWLGLVSLLQLHLLSLSRVVCHQGKQQRAKDAAPLEMSCPTRTVRKPTRGVLKPRGLGLFIRGRGADPELIQIQHPRRVQARGRVLLWGHKCFSAQNNKGLRSTEVTIFRTNYCEKIQELWGNLKV